MIVCSGHRFCWCSSARSLWFAYWTFLAAYPQRPAIPDTSEHPRSIGCLDTFCPSYCGSSFCTMTYTLVWSLSSWQSLSSTFANSSSLWWTPKLFRVSLINPLSFLNSRLVCFVLSRLKWCNVYVRSREALVWASLLWEFHILLHHSSDDPTAICPPPGTNLSEVYPLPWIQK